MHELLLAVFKNLEQENIQYCLMRDAERLDEFSKGGEVDLLVQASQLPQLHTVLAGLGFVSLPSWGHAPHHTFVAYSQASDTWLKLDFISEVTYGSPIPTLRTNLASVCLATRRPDGPTFILTPECELITMLLHCVLDKGKFAPKRAERLQALSHQVTDGPLLSAWLKTYWSSTMTWPQLADLLAAGSWDVLLAARKQVKQTLQNRDRLGIFVRYARDRVLRKANVWMNARRPSSLTVALLAPDGGGKSTLVTGLQDSFYFPVQAIYMGLYQKGSRTLLHSKLPGLGFVSRLGIQWTRYLTARAHQTRRRLVIFDRYTYDSLLPSRQRLSPLKRARRWLLAHSCPAPDLVIMLDVPGEMLYARKGEHSAELLEQQRQNYLKLKPHLPQMVVVNATQDADAVRREVIALIWRGYLAKQAGIQTSQAMSAAQAQPQVTMVS
ncbi:MAG: hypothetical protein NT075_02550 [Chloroflexi bacterium]|nr:hypothetical protein [Chloroflexota bacterium]